MNIAAAVIPFLGVIKTFQVATSPEAICCVLRLDTIEITGTDIHIRGKGLQFESRILSMCILTS